MSMEEIKELLSLREIMDLEEAMLFIIQKRKWG